MKNSFSPWTSASFTRVYSVLMIIDRYFSAVLTGKRAGYADDRVVVTKGVEGDDETMATGEGVRVAIGALDGNTWGEVFVGNGTVWLGTSVAFLALDGGFGLLHAETAIANPSNRTTIFFCMMNPPHLHMKISGPQKFYLAFCGPIS